MNSCVEKFDFGKAIELLKEGKCVCREGWNSKNLFICKQILANLMGTSLLTSRVSLLMLRRFFLLEVR